MTANAYVFYAALNASYAIVGYTLALFLMMINDYLPTHFANTVGIVHLILLLISYILLITCRILIPLIITNKGREYNIVLESMSKPIQGIIYAITLFLVLFIFFPLSFFISSGQGIVFRILFSAILGAYAFTPIIADRIWSKGKLW